MIVSLATLSTWGNLKDKNAKVKMVRINHKNLLLIEFGQIKKNYYIYWAEIFNVLILCKT